MLPKQCHDPHVCQRHVQVNINVECAFVKDMLQGDDVYEMRLKFLQQNAESYPYKDED